MLNWINWIELSYLDQETGKSIDNHGKEKVVE